ncbi:hypothetical protein NMG60_11027806 [Bertholletia excelsa]
MSENDAFTVPLDTDDPNTIFADGILSHLSTVPPAQPNSHLLNNENQMMSEFPALSMLQRVNMENPCTGLSSSNHVGFVACDGLIPRNGPHGRNPNLDSSLSSSCHVNSMEVQERLMGGTLISAASLATLLAARSSPHDDLDDLATSRSLGHPVEILKRPASIDYFEALNSALATSVNCGDYGFLTGMDNQLDFGSGRTGFQPFQFMRSIDPIGWMSSENGNVGAVNPSGFPKLSNELSLSLATCHPSIIHGRGVPDQSSEISCTGVAQVNERRLSLEKSSNIKYPCPSFDSCKYLQVIQKILAEIASYSLENLDQINNPGIRIGPAENLSFSSSSLDDRGYAVMASEGDGRLEVWKDFVDQGQGVETKKEQLLTLLQVVDERYNQCLDEIHTVVSAFHAATELDPHLHTRFALQRVSTLYKNLRERISNQILAMGVYFDKGDTREEERLFEASFIQKQWALQQLRRKDHQLWRPQRGLPERSVSVLRAWMFQNFLHPYPKDAEKHLLAVKSGLTRSQVSNWFINARVRLWKPMIEEMYAEMNRRKGRRINVEETDEGNLESSHVRIDGRRYSL